MGRLISTKYDIGDLVAIAGKIKSISIDERGILSYFIELTNGQVAQIFDEDGLIPFGPGEAI